MNVLHVLRTYHIHPLKRLGQNFLIDNNIQDKLCGALNLKAHDAVLEIGAGCGALTEKIAWQCSYLLAIECDKKLCHILQHEIVSQCDHVSIVCEDILKVNVEKHLGTKRVKVIGNLPYYITTKILFWLVKYRKHIDYAILTMQKEVAERLLSAPGKKTYGRLTVSLRFFAEVEKLFDIKANSFCPVPEVTSTVVKVTFRDPQPKAFDEPLFLRVVEALFQERRKNVHNGLCLVKTRRITKQEAERILNACNIPLKKRAEELMLKDFMTLTRCISAMKEGVTPLENEQKQWYNGN
ncbi:MAG: ribosomal RNA small subunit methyltransferase A [Candidatus Omnitrophica bacterium]|nr:ribosomal RNA small subunit methyltransferase A [Candidatus Omnitrophota bacterium]